MDKILRALIVEDSEEDADLIVLALRHGGVNLESQRVCDADDMRAALNDETWDVILADHAMPRFDAPAALKVLKESGLDCPFVIVSGRIGEEAAVAVMKAGANDYVAKDQLSRLVPVIERVIREVESRAARRKAEQALRATDERLRFMTDSMPALIAYVDTDKRYRLVNKTYEKWFGVSRQQVVGRTIEEVFGPVVYGRIRPHVEAALQGISTRHEVTIPEKDGEGERHLDAVYVPDYDERGVVKGYIVLTHDVSQRKEAERRLRQVQRNEALGQLTGGVAHDFNNLLTIIIGSLDMIEEKEEKNSHIAVLADRALKAAQRGALLTQRLLAFSRQQALQPKVIDINGMIEGMTELLLPTLGASIDFEVIGSDDLWDTLVDPSQLENAVLNLAINARDAMAEGGKLTIVSCNADIRNPQLAREVGVTPGDYVMLSVTDTGCGMSETTRERAFDPFFSTKAMGKGTGLGLSMVYGFVGQSGGMVTIKSSEGLGTTISVYLPRADSANGKATPEPAPSFAPKAGSEMVLVVEDDADVRSFTVSLLSDLGYRVVDAEDAERAMSVLETTKLIDLLLTDIVLSSGMSGLQLADAAQQRYPSLRVLYMSGYTDDVIVHHGRAHEGLFLINKPFQRGELARSVRSVLDR